MAAVHPVHEGEEGDAAHEEGEQNHTSVGLVKTSVLVADLVEEETQEEEVVRSRTSRTHVLTFSQYFPGVN